MKFLKINKNDIRQYKLDMQEAFQMGAIEGGLDVKEEIILPESDIDNSLNNKDAIAYKVVINEKMVGGAIIVIDKENKTGHLDFLYVKHGTQGKGIGKFIWYEIEKRHPEINIWETCTPYFEKRNIHFYINVCGFYAVEFFNSHHKDPNEKEDDFGMFVFRKIIPNKL